jgi:hypothetical protein
MHGHDEGRMMLDVRDVSKSFGGLLAGPLVVAAFFVLVRDVLAANLVNVHLIIFSVIFILVVLVLPGGLIEIYETVSRRLARRSTAVVTEVGGNEA